MTIMERGLKAAVDSGDVADVAPRFQFFADPAELEEAAARNDGALTAADVAGACSNSRQRRLAEGPKRARSRRTAETAAYFKERYGDPLDILGELINTPIDKLFLQMKALSPGEKIKVKDIMNLYMRAIELSMPYVHGKQPLQIDTTRTSDVTLVIEDTGKMSQVSHGEADDKITERGLAALPETASMQIIE